MQTIFGLTKIKRIPGALVALGVFDGVHRAHREILKYAVKEARRIKGKSVAVTFWPHPQKEASLYSLAHRLRLISELGIDICVVINFNRSFANISAEDFVKDVLLDKLDARYILVGKNFRFGKDASGNPALLEKLSRRYHFRLKVFSVMKVRGLSISSTYIRRAISRGELKVAQDLLLRPVSILGTVMRGNSLGRRIGFPTANINPRHEVLPSCGIYAVKIIFGKVRLKGVCYIGTRPTLSRKKIIHVEVHIFNFRRNIYGKDLEINFIRKMRSDKKFPSLDLLAKAIKKDAALAKKLLSSP